MTKSEKQIFDGIKKMGLHENIGRHGFEKIQILEGFKDYLKDPKDKEEVDAEIAKLRASPEFKEYEVEKKLEKIKEDF